MLVESGVLPGPAVVVADMKKRVARKILANQWRERYRWPRYSRDQLERARRRCPDEDIEASMGVEEARDLGRLPTSRAMYRRWMALWARW